MRESQKPGRVATRELRLVEIDQERDIPPSDTGDEQFESVLGEFRVQRGHRLVGQNDVGFLHQCPGDCGSLLLATGESLDAPVAVAVELDLRQHRLGLGPLGSRVEPEEAQPGRHPAESSLQHVVDRGQARYQKVLLVDHGNASLAASAIAHRSRVAAENADGTGRWSQPALDQAGERSLARAAVPEHEDSLTGTDLEPLDVERERRAVKHMHGIEFDQGRGARTNARSALSHSRNPYLRAKAATSA